MKHLIVFIVLWFDVVDVVAQTNYYTTTKTFYESGYTYQCDVPVYKLVSLYNIENKLTYTDVIYAETGKFYAPELGDPPHPLKDDNWTKQLCNSIVNKTFSDSEKARVKGREFGVIMCINSQTGKVEEVYFKFTTFGPYATIPVSVYRKIETEIKSKVWFTPTAEGRKLNYIFRAWNGEPQVIPPPKPLKPSWNGDLLTQLERFAPKHNYGKDSSTQWPKYIYPDMFNFTDNPGSFNANIYISGTGKAMVEFCLYNQTDNDIELNTSKIKVRLERYDGYIYPEITQIYSYNNGQYLSITDQKIIIPAEGGSYSFTLSFDNIIGYSVQDRELYDCKMKIFYEDQSMLNYILDERYDWNTENDYIEGTWYRGGYIMFRYMYNTGKQEMYYNRTTGQYFY